VSLIRSFHSFIILAVAESGGSTHGDAEQRGGNAEQRGGDAEQRGEGHGQGGGRVNRNISDGESISLLAGVEDDDEAFGRGPPSRSSSSTTLLARRRIEGETSASI
jgi:hypothetical protein